jgi:hypothetical protein
MGLGVARCGGPRGRPAKDLIAIAVDRVSQLREINNRLINLD